MWPSRSKEDKSGRRGQAGAEAVHARFEATVMPHLDAAYNLARWLSGSATDADEWAQGEAPTKVVLSRNDSDSTVTYDEKKDRNKEILDRRNDQPIPVQQLVPAGSAFSSVRSGSNSPHAANGSSWS